MKFVSIEMPVEVDPDGLSPEAKRALSIYTEIDESHYFKVDNPLHQNQLLGDFVDRETYGAVDEDGQLQGISLYIPSEDAPYGWIEGLAVHPESRRKHVGSFLVQNMAVARLDGKERLGLMSTRSASGFWIGQGFTHAGVADVSDDLGMSLEI
ncbi:MAG: Acetyltransferase domain [Candidatus Saccharibacteria bacterium]|nr:Acetyltransferase domain [Candidatus Saccharibacteria bacterium]